MRRRFSARGGVGYANVDRSSAGGAIATSNSILAVEDDRGTPRRRPFAAPSAAGQSERQGTNVPCSREIKITNQRFSHGMSIVFPGSHVIKMLLRNHVKTAPEFFNVLVLSIVIVMPGGQNKLARGVF